MSNNSTLRLVETQSHPLGGLGLEGEEEALTVRGPPAPDVLGVLSVQFDGFALIAQTVNR